MFWSPRICPEYPAAFRYLSGCSNPADMRCDIPAPLHKLLYHQGFKILPVNNTSFPDSGASGIVVDIEDDIPIGQGTLLHPEWKQTAGNGPHGIDCASIPVKYAGGILFALHDRQIQYQLSSCIFDFNIAAIIFIKSIHDV